MDKKLKIYSLSYGGNSWMAEDLRPIIEKLGMTLITIHEHDNADIKWELKTWLSHLRKADIVIAPANYRVQPAKSANRLVQAMSLGKPVICSPLPAYLDVSKEHPGSFLIADSPDEWEERLTLLKNDPFRKQIGEKALKAAQSYSIDVIGNKWLELLKASVPSKNSNKQDSLVDIVIPTYKNLRGLRLCINSIIACTAVPYKIIVVNNGDDEELHKYCDQRNDIVYIKEKRMNFSQANNVGIKAGTSKYVVLLNDDIIVSKGWLKSLIDACTEKVGAVGPLSNCDYSWLHRKDINIGGVELLPGSNTFEQIEPIIPQIYEYKSPYSEIKEQEWVAFYCTLIPRSVINEAGFLDEDFTNSGEDVDYCKRIRKQGYRILQNYKSFVFHFGAVSRKILESEDKGSYQEADRLTRAYLKEKYEKKLLVLYSGPSWEHWDFRNFEKGGIGGSENWVIYLSREFVKLEFRVVVFADCPESGIMDGDIKYLHYGEFEKFAQENYIDYLILSRTTDPLRVPVRAGKIYCQIHDIWLLSSKDQLFLDKVDNYCALSQWHLDFASDHHGIPKEKMRIMANGIDPSLYQKKVERNPHRLFWSSSWDRGLDNVLYLLPFIQRTVPDVELHITYGVHNWKESCKHKGNEEGLKKIKNLEDQIEENDNVFDHGRIPQKELAVEFLKSGLWLYPTWFTETFSITAISAQIAGVPVVCSKYAGLITTLGDSAVMIDGKDDPWYPYTKEGREAFLREALKMLTDEEHWKYWQNKGYENAQKYTWEQSALRWVKLFEEESPKKEVIIPEIADPIDPEKYKGERVSAHEMNVGDNYMPNPHRHLAIERDNVHYFKAVDVFGSSDSCSALDVGCFDGWIDFLLMEQGFKVTGVELIEPLVLAARRYAQSNEIDYKIYQGFFEDIEIDEKFDLVMCLETLEHINFDLVPVYIEKMEKLATKGIFISLPDQKHEDNSQHLWTPTKQLIESMWGDRKNFDLSYYQYKNAEVPSNWFVYFEV